MNNELIPGRTIVKTTRDVELAFDDGVPAGRIGHITASLGAYSMADPGETTVRFDGNTHATHVPVDALEVIDTVDPIPEPERCGAGGGAECCIFLTAARDGFKCMRNTDMHLQLAFNRRKMAAQRLPTEIYPSCMQPETDE